MHRDDDFIFFDKSGQQHLPLSIVFFVSLTPIVALLFYWLWTERKQLFRT